KGLVQCAPDGHDGLQTIAVCFNEEADLTAQHAQTSTIPTSTPGTGGEPWTLHEDRALPADATVRPLAREIYAATKGLPIVSMHGHVEAQVLDEDTPFGDPAELFVIPDHYLVRMIVSQGGSVD